MGFLDALLNKLTPQRDQSLPPNVQQAMDIMTRETSDFQPSQVRRANLLDRLLTPPDTMAHASPTGKISVDVDAIGDRDAQSIADVLLHEQTHVRQDKQRGMLPSIWERISQNLGAYGQRPDELEAYQAEADRRLKMGRQPQLGQPSFEGKSKLDRTRGDVHLRAPKKR